LVATSDSPPSGKVTHRQVPDWGHPLFVYFFVAPGVSDLPATDIYLKQFLTSIGADPAAGMRHFSPDAAISVRDFIHSSSYL
jgi:hypothetical protein